MSMQNPLQAKIFLPSPLIKARFHKQRSGIWASSLQLVSRARAGVTAVAYIYFWQKRIPSTGSLEEAAVAPDPP